MYQLNFQQKAEFKSLETGITIKAILRLENIEFTTRAKLDTGSEICLFKREIGEYLEIDTLLSGTVIACLKFMKYFKIFAYETHERYEIKK